MKAANETDDPCPRRHRLATLGALALAALLCVVFFRSALDPACYRFTTDDNIGINQWNYQCMPGCFRAWYMDTPLAGQGYGRMPLTFTSLLLWSTSPAFFLGWVHGLYLLGASAFMILFLRARGIGVAACLMGVLTAYWVGSNLTLAYAGHVPKFAVLMLASAALWLVDRAAERTAPWRWSLAAGGAIGYMFIEQQDVALFFGLFLGAYALFRFLPLVRERWQQGLPLLATAAVALVTAGPALLGSYEYNVVSVARERTVDADEQWAFATQWSWPPEESIDFIAPGYMGWRSGEPDGPYWGRMGGGAGFPNFKLESQYLGAIPLLLALIALFAAFRRTAGAGRADPRRRELIFWSAAAAVALLLAFGKYFPLYRLFFELPVVSNIRNPNKFLQVFQWCAGLLAAYGLQRLLAAREREAGS